MNRSDLSFRSSCSGAALIEFALSLPLLLLLLLGGTEVLYYLRLTQQMEKTVQMTGSIMAQMTRVSEEDFPLFFTISDTLLQRSGDDWRQNHVLRIRQYGCKDSQCRFNWWRDGAGEMPAPDSPTGPLPQQFSFRNDENLLHVVLWVRYRPLIGHLLGWEPHMLQREGLYRTADNYPLDHIVKGKRP